MRVFTGVAVLALALTQFTQSASADFVTVVSARSNNGNGGSDIQGPDTGDGPIQISSDADGASSRASATKGVLRASADASGIFFATAEAHASWSDDIVYHAPLGKKAGDKARVQINPASVFGKFAQSSQGARTDGDYQVDFFFDGRRFSISVSEVDGEITHRDVNNVSGKGVVDLELPAFPIVYEDESYTIKTILSVTAAVGGQNH